MSGKLTLTVTRGPMAGEAFVFDGHDTLLFGRLADCKVRLPNDKTVSRHHFILEVNPPEVRIRDLGSMHGTHVNGQKYGGREKDETPEEGARREYPQVDLRDGDEIKVGKTVLLVHVEADEKFAGPTHCQRCGKDFSAEDQQADTGAAICPQCRLLVEHDPMAMLLTLLQRSQHVDGQAVSLNDYEAGRQLGVGGMGAVYLARHKRSGEQVAVKVMLSKMRVNDRARLQFLREIETTSTLRHPHIVQFLGNGVEGNFFFFLLEYCDGGSVDDLVKRRGGKLSVEEARPIVLQTLEGLAYVHEQGFVHRDIKPQNMLLSGHEGQWNAKISDLGLAKCFEQAGFSGMTATGNFAGSFPFMPREQVVNFKHLQPTSDVWAMGASFYHLLTGAYPRVQLRGQDPLLAILQGEITPLRQQNARIPASIAAVIDRSLANKEEARYQNAGEMHEALKKAFVEA